MAMHVVAKCAFQVTSALPRDYICINPCFRHNGALPADWDDFASDLADALLTWTGTSHRLRVSIHDLEGSPPVYPVGESIKNPGVGPTPSGQPREIALCLSYYGEHNIPKQRGRLYIPMTYLGGSVGERPSGPQMTKAMAVGPILAGAGGADMDWIVWSRVNQAATQVKNYWVDDEWDVQRSRGLKSTTRNVATTSG